MPGWRKPGEHCGRRCGYFVIETFRTQAATQATAFHELGNLPPPTSPVLPFRPPCIFGPSNKLMAMESRDFATRDDLWRLQETLNDLSATQALHSDRIMRLEQKTPDGSRTRGLWGASSPFPGSLSHHGMTRPAQMETPANVFLKSPPSTLRPKRSGTSTQILEPA